MVLVLVLVVYYRKRNISLGEWPVFFIRHIQRHRCNPRCCHTRRCL